MRRLDAAMTLLFRLFGFPTRIHFSFLLVTLVLWFSTRSSNLAELPIWLAAVLVGVLMHELGHAWTARLFGASPQIVLHGMGGLTWWPPGVRLSPARRMIVTATGPAVGIAIGSSLLLVSQIAPIPRGSLVEFAIDAAVRVNLGWGLLNLIPMLPLDGGQLLASVLELLFGTRASLWARITSVAIAAVLFVWTLMPALLGMHMGIAGLLVPMLVASLGWSNLRALRLERQVAADLPFREEILAIRRAADRHQHDEVVLRAEDLLPRLTTPAVRAEILHILAWSLLLQKEAARALEALARLPHGAAVDPALHGAALADSGAYSAALPLLEQALLMRRGPLVEERLGRTLRELRLWDRAVAIFSSRAGGAVSLEAVEDVERAAFEAGAFTAAARLNELMFTSEGSASYAFGAACANARAGDAAAALPWLQRAVDAGLADLALLEGEPALASVRALPGYADVRAAVGRERVG